MEKWVKDNIKCDKMAIDKEREKIIGEIMAVDDFYQREELLRMSNIELVNILNILTFVNSKSC